MQVLYDKLYRSANVSEVSLSEYIGPLIDEIIKNFPNHDKVHIDKNIENCLIDAKILSSLGIIVNELLTNSMKYAFPGYSKGEIFISSWLNGKEVTFIIQDFGIGMPESISIESSTGIWPAPCKAAYNAAPWKNYYGKIKWNKIYSEIQYLIFLFTMGIFIKVISCFIIFII